MSAVCSALDTPKRHLNSLRAPCSTRPGTYCARRPHCTHTASWPLNLQEMRVNQRRTPHLSYTMTCCGKPMAIVPSSHAGLRISAAVLRLQAMVRACLLYRWTATVLWCSAAAGQSAPFWSVDPTREGCSSSRAFVCHHHADANMHDGKDLDAAAADAGAPRTFFCPVRFRHEPHSLYSKPTVIVVA